MSYVESISGDPINPIPFTYSAISMTGNITLGWPLNSQTSTYTATSWVDITASVGSLVATLSDAREIGIGQEVVFYNYGANTITINDAGGNSIITVASGLTKRIWLTANATAAGTWRFANIGSGSTTVDASVLAGYGLTALSGQLSLAIPNTSYSTNTTITAGLRAYLVLWTGGAGTLTLTSAATLGSNWFFYVKNVGSGSLTIGSGGSNIDGSASITVGLLEGFTIASNGTTFYTIGRNISTSAGLTALTKSVAGSADVTLTSTEAANGVLNFTGILTGDIDVIVPDNLREWIVYNATTGTFTLTVKTAAGTGITVPQATRQILYSDGTNVQIANNTSGTGTVTSVASGTGLTGGPITATGTLSIANTAVVAGTYGAAMGVISITSNAQGQLTAASFTARSITGTTNEITATNGDGVAGAPTLSLPTALTFTGKTVTNGTFVTPTIASIVNTGTTTLNTITGTVAATVSVQSGGDSNSSASGSGSDHNYDKTYTLAANSLTANRAVRVFAHFKVSTGSAPPDLIVKLKLGSTTIYQNNDVTPAANLSNDQFGVTWIFQATQSPSGSSNLECAHVGQPGNLTTTNNLNTVNMPVSVATNASKAITIASQWSAAGTGTNTIALDQLVVEVLN